MAGTACVLTSPAPGTVVRPIHVYSDEQSAQIEVLRQVGV